MLDPRHAKHSTNNSWTAPSKIARRRKIAEALGYREQGHSFVEIAKQMKVSVSTAHDWIVEGLNLIPLENAKQVLAMELKRLDSYLAAYHADAVEGSIPATEMALQIMRHRARLLGLYPEQGKTTALLIASPQLGDGGEVKPAFQIEFVTPVGREPAADAPSAPEHAPCPWQKALPPPPPRLRQDNWGNWVPDEG